MTYLSMANNNIVEQFEEIYSRWNLLDKAGKDLQLGNMMQNVYALYQFLMQSYTRKGFLTQEEANKVQQIKHLYLDLQNQKTQIDNDLWNEMMKRFAKMIVKRSY